MSVRILGIITFVSLVLSSVVWAEEVKLPDGTMTCMIDSDDRDECIKDALQDMIPKLYGGLSSLNIPPIDPLVLNRSHFEYNRGPMHGALLMKTATVYGLTRTQIRAVRTVMEPNGMQIEIDAYYPRVLIEGVYKADGQFNGYKMNARGNFNVTFKHVATSVKMGGEFVDVDGERYLHITAFDAAVDMDNMKVQANGIFPEPELNKLALEFVNQNWPSIYRVMIPETKDIWEPRMIDEMNAFTMHVPFRLLLH